MFTSHYTSNQGVKLHYQRAGQGPAVMLVMGLGMPGSLWEGLAQRLVEDGLEVIIPDNRGTGRSQTPRSPWPMTAMGDDAAKVLDHAGISRAIVCGVSLGGMISQNLAVRHPHKVRGLVLCNTTCGLPYGKFLSPVALSKLLRLAIAPKAAGPDLAHEVLGHPERRAEFDLFIQRVMRHRGQTPTTIAGMIGQLLAGLSHSTGADLPSLRMPTHVIGAAGDALIPNENSKILAERIPNAKLSIIPRTGHILPHEEPDVLEEAILELLDLKEAL